MKTIFDLSDLCEATHGEILCKNHSQFSDVTTDSRVKNDGHIFFALKGERFDAHDFLLSARESGASCLVIHRRPSEQEIQKLGDVTIVKVEDTLIALQQFAHYWRRKLKTTIVGVAGSNGKTTTKNFAATLIAGKFPVICTRGSLNNHIGVPLTLLAMRPEHKVGVIEMGMNHFEELARLTEIADPDICIVTTIAHEHIEFFGSLEKIAQAEEEIYKYARPEAIRIFNLDNDYTKAMRERAPRPDRVLSFSAFDQSAHVSLKEMISKINYIEITGRIDGEPGVARVPVFGRHNINNLMAASAIAIACGVEADVIWKRLSQCQGEWGRSQLIETEKRSHVIFDAYNANLESSLALIENFSRLSVSGRRIAVFADMLEMGDHAPELHQKWGYAAGKAGFDLIWFYGAQREAFERGLKESKYSKRLYISDTFDSEVAGEIYEFLGANDVALLKGSRGMKLERVLNSWHPLDFSEKH